ncbi:hypothetical protein, partial [Klebsiella variicola]|uniref:hypothetical protein n=1 Tax=Klebsiella variicola TaxID=244366 RepID=UPI0039C3596B
MRPGSTNIGGHFVVCGRLGSGGQPPSVDRFAIVLSGLLGLLTVDAGIVDVDVAAIRQRAGLIRHGLF